MFIKKKLLEKNNWGVFEVRSRSIIHRSNQEHDKLFLTYYRQHPANLRSGIWFCQGGGQFCRPDVCSGVAANLELGTHGSSLLSPAYPPLPIPLPFPRVLPPLPSFRSTPLKSTMGSGERCKLPQRGLGRSRNRNRIRCILAFKMWRLHFNDFRGN